VVRRPNWFIDYFLLSLPHTSNFSLLNLRRVLIVDDPSPSRLNFIYIISLPTIQVKAWSPYCSTIVLALYHNSWRSDRGFYTQDWAQRASARAQTATSRHQTITPTETNRRARAPPMVRILSESIRIVRFEVLLECYHLDLIFVSWSLDNPVLIDSAYSHLCDFKNQLQQSDN